jgi:hypothetical protein
MHNVPLGLAFIDSAFPAADAPFLVQEGSRIMKRLRGGMRVGIPALAFAATLLCSFGLAAAPRYPWRSEAAAIAETLTQRVQPPRGFRRIAATPGSFGEWLRGLPLRPPKTQIMLHDGRAKANQGNHVAVIDIDTGPRDLQQCADAIMRLRAEYLLGTGRARDIAFNYTDGTRQPFRGKPEDYKEFRRYMERIFSFAGSWSLEREMRPVPLAEMRIGDVFIKGGFPGHAVLVVDMAEHESNGEKRFLVMQSFMPAQDMHVLTNPKSADGTPWYAVPAAGQELVTPEWTFPAGTLRRFKD